MEEVKDPQKSNFKILEVLEEFLYNNLDIRFCQALQILGINKQEELMGLVDNFNEKSEDTLNRINGRKEN